MPTRDVLFLAVLILVCWIAYSPLQNAGYINLDDPEYVVNNRRVTGGMTPANVRWALTATRASNWHPVTWWSHQLDAEIWGMNPGGHHTTNIILHLLNAVFVYFLFSRLTESRPVAAVVAGLFALHPVNVESVAWISERKNLLSSLFGFGTLIVYSRYGRRPTVLRYVAVTLLFALSLMCKPMLVTLPFLMLLLDVWPLARLQIAPTSHDNLRKLGMVLAEKIPWLLMSVLSSAITMFVQHDARATTGDLPLWVRIENAVLSYVNYLGLLVWPDRLALSYPHPLDSIPTWKIIAALALLACTTGVVRWSRPVYRLGWLWYLGTLVPVLGLVQVGKQAMADRYLYWPALGIFLIFSFAGEAISGRIGQQLWRASVLVALTVCGLLTYQQATYWQSSRTLMEHTIRKYPENAVALYLAGMAHQESGEMGLAHQRLAEAVRVAPFDLQAGLAYAKFHMDAGDYERALSEYGRLTQAFPASRELRLWRGVAYARKGDFKAAKEDLKEASEAPALTVDAHYNLGLIAIRAGDWESAHRHLAVALTQDPVHLDSLLALAAVAEQSGDRAADPLLRRGIALAPNPRVIAATASAYLSRRESSDALELLSQGVISFPEDKTLWYMLGVTRLQCGDEAEAVDAFMRSLQIDPSYLASLNDLAWLLATTRKQELPIVESLSLAKRAQALAPEDPGILDTVAAALAANGRFSDAIAVVDRAVAIAAEQQKEGLRRNLLQRRELYRQRLPYKRDAAAP